MNNKEVFKKIPGYDNVYEISNFGNVKSLGNNKKRKEKILKSSVNSKGYKTVRLKGKTKDVHQLVAIAFLNHIPCGDLKVVDHKDNNPLNNHLNNLEIITHRKNISKNAKSNNSSKTIGVIKVNHKWLSNICIGSFDSEEKASDAYNKVLKFIEINFVK